MPPPAQKQPEKSLEEIVDELGLFPLEAFVFLHEGIAYAVHSVHGKRKSPEQNMHVTGQQLCESLRDYAIAKYGMMAGLVLRSWGVRVTFDFGRMVYAMIEAGHFSKTETDSLDDFRDVYDFKTAFDPAGYKIASKP